MSLIPQTTLNAAEIDRINREMVSYIRHQLTTSYDLVMLDPQAVLSVMGDKAANALTSYATLHAALDSLGAAAGLTAPNFEVFQPQADGSVIYVAPPEPEPQPEPEPIEEIPES